jgi:signal transduction histidine kinase
MELTRRNAVVYAVLFAVWVLVVGWQIEEHLQFKDYARTALRNRSKDIANTLGASIRGLQFRSGAVFGDRLQPVLKELVNGHTNELLTSAEVLGVALLNAAGKPVASAGRPIDLEQQDIRQAGERWGPRGLTVVYPIEGASLLQEGATNPLAPLLLDPPTNSMREGGRPRREPRPPETASTNSLTGTTSNSAPAELGGPPAPAPDGELRPRRPFWARRLNEKDYQSLIEQRELHGLALVMSTDTLQASGLHDLWLRFVIAFFASVSALGTGVAWRTLAKSSELQIRLVRASEMNTHLKEMNLAAAGLAHETRNPLNIIRGLAQMISKRDDAPSEIREKTRGIIEETDKVTAQLNEFINYSRPREVRRSPLALNSAITEVVRALNYDLEEKKIVLDVKGEQLRIEADEQLFRQALFNLVLNAIQAVNGSGHIDVVTARQTASEASLEVRDNGPGVPPERRAEIFKPYFTTQKQGTGLGLAVVQQIVLAHGWEIECLANEPQGATFRITHLKLAA